MMMDERPESDNDDDGALPEAGVKSREGADPPGSTQRSGSGDTRRSGDGSGDTR